MTTHCPSCGGPRRPRDTTCFYCGTPWSQVPEPEPTPRRVVRGTMQTHARLEGVELRGDMNTVQEAVDCTIVGSMNVIHRAVRCVVRGDMNTLHHARDCDVQGAMNKVRGP